MAFRGTPAYQKAILRLNREERDVLDTLLIEQEFGAAEGKKQLALARLGARKELGEKRLAFGEKGIESRYELGKTRMETGADISREAIEQQYDLGMERLATETGIRRKEREFTESQIPTQRLLGIGNVLAGTLLGYAGMRMDIAQAERDETRRRELFGGY